MNEAIGKLTFVIESHDAAVATNDSSNPRNRLPPQIFLVAYLVHLTVPLVLALDSFRTMYEDTADNLTRVMGLCLHGLDGGGSGCGAADSRSPALPE